MNKTLLVFSLMSLVPLASCAQSAPASSISQAEFIETINNYDQEKTFQSLKKGTITQRFYDSITRDLPEAGERTYEYQPEELGYAFAGSKDKKELERRYDGSYWFVAEAEAANSAEHFVFYKTGSWTSKSVTSQNGGLSFKGTFVGEIVLIGGLSIDPPAEVKADCEWTIDSYGMVTLDSTKLSSNNKEIYAYVVSYSYEYAS